MNLFIYLFTISSLTYYNIPSHSNYSLFFCFKKPNWHVDKHTILTWMDTKETIKSIFFLSFGREMMSDKTPERSWQWHQNDHDRHISLSHDVRVSQCPFQLCPWSFVMVLGFAVVALFMVAVVSTIVATVNEMKKPPRPDPDASPMAPPLALLLPGDPNVTVFDAKKFADHEKLQNGEIEGYVSTSWSLARYLFNFNSVLKIRNHIHIWVKTHHLMILSLIRMVLSKKLSMRTNPSKKEVKQHLQRFPLKKTRKRNTH